MRISVEPSDAGYELFQEVLEKKQKVTVLLDDFPVKACITADDVAGSVKFYVTDHQGQPADNPDGSGKWIRTALGKVEIEIN